MDKQITRDFFGGGFFFWQEEAALKEEQEMERRRKAEEKFKEWLVKSNEKIRTSPQINSYPSSKFIWIIK